MSGFNQNIIGFFGSGSSGGGGGGNPAPPLRSVQFNNAGAFGGDASYLLDTNFNLLQGDGVRSSTQYSHAEGNSTGTGGYAAHSEGYESWAGRAFQNPTIYTTNTTGDSLRILGDQTGFFNPTAIFFRDGSDNISAAVTLLSVTFDGTNTNIVSNGVDFSASGVTFVFANHWTGTNPSNSQQHAEGYGTVASGDYSHSEGWYSKSIGTYSHAEGNDSMSIGNSSHSEGFSTYAIGESSHAEGISGISTGNFSHAEGSGTKAIGVYSHAEGVGCYAIGVASHAEGADSQSNGDSSHAEGDGTQANGLGSHAEGGDTQAVGIGSHSEGLNTWAGKGFPAYTASVTNVEIAGGDFTAYFTTGSPMYFSTGGSGIQNSAITSVTYDGFYFTTIVGTGDFSSGIYFFANVLSQAGQGQHSEGQLTLASGDFSHAEGFISAAIGAYSHAEGYQVQANGIYSHAEGAFTESRGDSTHAEGSNTVAIGTYSHAEGDSTQANGDFSHAEGSQSFAIGTGSHAEGVETEAAGDYSHAEGYGTYAKSFVELAVGSFNTIYTPSSTTAWVGTDRLFGIGNGTSNTSTSDAVVVLKNGQIGVGTATPQASALVDFTSTTLGLLFPRMTTVEKNLITPVEGLIVYDLTLHALSLYNGTIWTTIT